MCIEIVRRAPCPRPSADGTAAGSAGAPVFDHRSLRLDAELRREVLRCDLAQLFLGQQGNLRPHLRIVQAVDIDMVEPALVERRALGAFEGDAPALALDAGDLGARRRPAQVHGFPLWLFLSCCPIRRVRRRAPAGACGARHRADRLAATAAAGEAALRAQSQPVEIDIARGLVDPPLDVVLALDHRGLRAHQPQHHGLALGHVPQRREIAGARGVEFEKEGVDLGLVEQPLGDRLVAAFRHPGALEIAAAHMHTDRHARRPLADRIVEQPDVARGSAHRDPHRASSRSGGCARRHCRTGQCRRSADSCSRACQARQSPRDRCVRGPRRTAPCRDRRCHRPRVVP